MAAKLIRTLGEGLLFRFKDASDTWRCGEMIYMQADGDYLLFEPLQGKFYAVPTNEATEVKRGSHPE